MTIALNNNTPRISYTVSEGVTRTTPFPVPFVFFDGSTDLNVYVDNVERTYDASTSNTTLYTVTGGDGSTGSVSTTVTGATGGSTVIITRDVPLARTTDFPSSGAFEIAKLNTELDTLLTMITDADDENTRALRLQDSDDAVSLTLPLKDARKGTVLGFNATTGAAEAGPTIADVSTLSAITADISTLADIEDGTDATDAIQTVAGISGDVTTVAGIESNVTTVAGIETDITNVAADEVDIGVVATNIDSVNTVATNIDDVVTVANDLNEAISEIETAANDLNEATSEIDTVANSIGNVDTVGLNIDDVTTVAGQISPTNNIATVAGDSTVINTVAGDSDAINTVADDSTAINAVANDATDIGNVSTNIDSVNTVAGQINPTNNIATVASADTNISTVAGQISPTNNIATVAGDSTDIGTVAGLSADIQALADIEDGTTATNAISNVGNSIDNVNTVASNLASVNNFAEVYRVSATAPTDSTDLGDLYFDTTSDTLKVYGASGWQNAGSSINGTSQRYHYDITSTVGSVTGADANGNTLTYDAGFVDVYVNGVRMSTADVTVTSGDTVTFTEDLVNGDEVDIVGYGTFSVASLNADNLDSGTVPSARVSGAYTGITSVGTLTSFASTGIDDNASSTAITIDASQNVTNAGALSINGALSAKGGAVFNEDSADVDFRVESNDDANMFRIEGATNNVKIGSNAGNYAQLSIKNEKAGSQERGLYVELSPASGTSPNNVAVFAATNSNMTQPLVRIHHESPTADQLLIQATTTGSNTVKFSVDEDGDIYTAGGVVFGSTGGAVSSKTLDDYEEGTFTPTLEDTGDALNANLTSQIGQYTKIGNLCHIQIRINGDSRSATNNQVYVGGLPFTPSLSDTSNRAEFEVNGINLNLDAGYYSIVGQILHGDTDFNLLMQGTSLENFRGHDLGSTYEIYVHGAYFTA